MPPSSASLLGKEPSEIWSPRLSSVMPGGVSHPRIGIAGIAIESSTFSPHISGVEDFVIRRGSELLDWYSFLAAGTPLGDAAEWIPLTHGRSIPGGAVDSAFYLSMKNEIVSGIAEAGDFDGFFFDIHGAMSVVGMEDAEADLARAVREVLGENTLVSAAMDLHGNVSRDLLDQVDLITCYRMAPHEDEWNTKERAVYNLLSQLRSDVGSDPVARRPFKAWLQVPVLLPGEKTSTRLEPAHGIYAEVQSVEAMPGVLDAALWVGYAWADEPRCQAAVVVTGFDEKIIAAEARRLGAMYWDARADFEFVTDALPLDRCIDAALAHAGPAPYVISDSGDNPTAGGAGDVSWTLRELLGRPEFASAERTVVHASIFDAAAVAASRAVGVGGTVDVFVGGRVDGRVCGPVRIVGTVDSITEGDPVAGGQVVIRSGGVHAIITERRKPFHFRDDFTQLGIDPSDINVVVVKIGYLEPDLYAMANGWKLALTPGGVDQDLVRLGHRNLVSGVYPFEQSGSRPSFDPLVTKR